MSGATAALERLVATLDLETDALLGGAPDPTLAALKSALVSEIERDAPPPDDASREAARRVRAAALRNRAALGALREAALALRDDLARRLAAVESDGTYRRSDLDPPASGAVLLPFPAEADGSGAP